MLPSFSVQVFNTLLNVIEAALLVYIALEKHISNQLIRSKQLETNNRLNNIFDLLNTEVDKKGNIK